MSAKSSVAEYLEEQRLDTVLSTTNDADLRRAFKRAMTVRDDAFDDLYLDGILKDGNMPIAPLKRRDRFRCLVEQLVKTAGISGVVAECGCWLGLSSFLLCHHLQREAPDFSGQGYEVYDSFQGLSAPTERDCAADPWFRDRSLTGLFVGPLEVVKARLSEFPHIAYFPGWIPSAFDAKRTTRYRFVHVDVDLYDPTSAAFRYFWPRLAEGGMVICDDYGGVLPARKAVDDFCEELGLRLDTTPFGQAYLIKGRM